MSKLTATVALRAFSPSVTESEAMSAWVVECARGKLRGKSFRTLFSDKCCRIFYKMKYSKISTNVR